MLWWRVVIVAVEEEEEVRLAPMGQMWLLVAAAVVYGGVDRGPLPSSCDDSRHECGSWPDRSDRRFERRGVR
jgi:hypothetical protein